MIKTLKQTISNIFYWIKKKLIQFKKWLIVLIFGATILAAPIIIPSVPDIALENIQADYHASELKDKYRLEKTAFILDAVDENAIQAEVGNKNLDSFEPSLTLRKWNDEVNFKVKYKHGEKEKDQKVDIENKKIKWKGKKTEVHYYDIKKGKLLHDKVLESDVYEVEVLLLEKPDTNIVEFDIETKGLKFYYQPELTQEEKDEGAIRPENVIGSYAVYHESKAGDYSQMGLKNYRAGKAFHIYRPKIVDSAGKEVWGELNIVDNLLTVEIPQEFLDNAVYPVIVDPTFGKTDIGGTFSTWTYADEKGFSLFTLGEAGNASKLTAYIYALSGVANVKGIIYENTGSKNLVGTSDESNIDTTQAWKDLSFTTIPSLTAQDYFLGIIGDARVNVKADSAGTNGYNVDTYSDGPSATLGSYTSSSYQKSIYCTYTSSGGDARRMFIVD